MCVFVHIFHIGYNINIIFLIAIFVERIEENYLNYINICAAYCSKLRKKLNITEVIYRFVNDIDDI